MAGRSSSDTSTATFSSRKLWKESRVLYGEMLESDRASIVVGSNG